MCFQISLLCVSQFSVISIFSLSFWNLSCAFCSVLLMWTFRLVKGCPCAVSSMVIWKDRDILPIYHYSRVCWTTWDLMMMLKMARLSARPLLEISLWLGMIKPSLKSLGLKSGHPWLLLFLFTFLIRSQLAMKQLLIWTRSLSLGHQRESYSYLWVCMNVGILMRKWLMVA